MLEAWALPPSITPFPFVPLVPAFVIFHATGFAAYVFVCTSVSVQCQSLSSFVIDETRFLGRRVRCIDVWIKPRK